MLQETERFKSAFQDPEFMKLMSEYVQDLQNPEYRAVSSIFLCYACPARCIPCKGLL